MIAASPGGACLCNGRSNYWRAIGLWLTFLIAICPLAFSEDAGSFEPLRTNASALQMSSVDPRRFGAGRGRRSVVMGYPRSGLEVWAFPLQSLSGYQIGVRSGQDAT